MSTQPDLFANAEHKPQSVSPATAVVSLKIAGNKLSPEQKRFNKLLERIEALTDEIAAAHELADAHRVSYATIIAPLEKAGVVMMGEMIKFLDKRVQQKGLSAKDLRFAREIICSLALGFAQAGDEAMRTIFDRHSDETVEDISREDAEDAQAFLDDMLGIDTPIDPNATAEEILSAGAERMREFEAEQERKQMARHDKRGKRKLKNNEATTADDPETVLRSLYRQLASKLHPDRETDEEEKIRKTRLMGDANAAYAKRDLMALLKLQLEIEQLDQDAISAMAKGKMAALITLLKSQVYALENDLQNVQGQIAMEFGLSPFARFDSLDAISLARSLKDQRSELNANNSQMEYDLGRVKASDVELKRWLKQQHKMMNNLDDMTAMFGML